MERVAHASAHQRACLRRCAHARRRHCAGPRGLEELWLASPAPPAACSAAPGVRRGRLCCRGQRRHRTPTPGGSGTTAAAGRGARPPAAAACRRRWWRACAALSRFMSRSLGDLGLIEVGEAVPAATSGVRAFCWVLYVVTLQAAGGQARFWVFLRCQRPATRVPDGWMKVVVAVAVPPEL
jgi:hypothetical protein